MSLARTIKLFIRRMLPAGMVERLYLASLRFRPGAADGLGRTPAEREAVEDTLRNSASALRDGAFEDARTLVETTLEAYPRNPRLLVQRARIAEDAFPEEAGPAWEAVLEVQPASFQAWRGRISAAARRDGPESVEPVFQKALSQVRTPLERDGLFIRARYEQGRLDEAEQELRKRIEAEEESAEAFDERWRTARYDISAHRFLDVDEDTLYERIASLLEKASERRPEPVAPHKGLALLIASLNPGTIERRATMLLAQMSRERLPNPFWPVELYAREKTAEGQDEILLDQLTETRIPTTDLSFYPRRRAEGCHDPVAWSDEALDDLPLRQAETARRVALRLLDTNPAALHAWGAGMAPAALLGAALAGTPYLLVSTFGPPPLRGEAIVRAALRAGLDKTRLILLADGADNAEAYAEWLGVPKRRIKTAAAPAPRLNQRTKAMEKALAQIDDIRREHKTRRFVICHAGDDAEPDVFLASFVKAMSAAPEGFHALFLGKTEEASRALADAAATLGLPGPAIAGKPSLPLRAYLARGASFAMIGEGQASIEAAGEAARSGTPVSALSRNLAATADGVGVFALAPTSGSYPRFTERLKSLLRAGAGAQVGVVEARRTGREAERAAYLCRRFSKLYGALGERDTLFPGWAQEGE